MSTGEVGPEPTVRKRVVLHHRTGGLAGLPQILGVLCAPATVLAKMIETKHQYTNDEGILKRASLIYSGPRRIEYREETA